MLLLLSFLALSASVEDRGLGKWQFVAAESRYESGPAPRESTRQWIAAGGNRVRFVHDGISADGKRFHTEFTAGYDGNPYPIQGGARYDEVALHWKDASTVEQVFTLKGVVTVRATRTISPDGKRMVIEARGDGFHNHLVYRRID
jgi:hypothetical protein